MCTCVQYIDYIMRIIILLTFTIRILPRELFQVNFFCLSTMTVLRRSRNSVLSVLYFIRELYSIIETQRSLMPFF